MSYKQPEQRGQNDQGTKNWRLRHKANVGFPNMEPVLIEYIKFYCHTFFMVTFISFVCLFVLALWIFLFLTVFITCFKELEYKLVTAYQRFLSLVQLAVFLSSHCSKKPEYAEKTPPAGSQAGRNSSDWLNTNQDSPFKRWTRKTAVTSRVVGL